MSRDRSEVSTLTIALETLLRIESDRRLRSSLPHNESPSNTGLTMDSEGDKQRTGIVTIPFGTEYGSMNLSEIVQIDQRLSEGTDDSRCPVLIDLERTVYFGCELLNVLLTWHGRLKQSHRRFALCGLKGSPREILALTCLDSLWEIFPTRREAVDAMVRPPDDTELYDELTSNTGNWRNTT